MTLYKPGDRVVVRDDLRVYTNYAMRGSEQRMTVVEEMLPFRGWEVTIAEVNHGFYFIEEDNHYYYWSDDMFTGYANDTPIKSDPAAWDSFFADFANISK